MSWSKFGQLVIGLVSVLVLEEAFSAVRANAYAMTSTLGSAFGSILTPIKSASEPSVLLIIGAFLLVVALRIRSIFAAKRGAE